MAKMSKTDRIRKMLNDDVPPAKIAEKLKISKSYVYNVKTREAKKRSQREAEWAERERREQAEARVAALPPDPLDVQIGGDHYKEMPIQPVQFIVANGIGFLEGCVIKRMCRWRLKGDVEDLEKAKHEIDLLLSLAD